MPINDGGPKESGRDEDGGPKESGRDEDSGPKESGRGDAESPFVGGGGGLVVVAFISQIGMNVPDLAIRMLGGGSAQPPPRSSQGPLADAAVLALEKARKLDKARKEERDLAGKYRQLMKLDDKLSE